MAHQQNGNQPRQALQGQGERLQDIQQPLQRGVLQDQQPIYQFYDGHIPTYQGWVLRKCSSKDLDPGMESSWKYCYPPSPMRISSKALVAQVKEHLATYAKKKNHCAKSP